MRGVVKAAALSLLFGVSLGLGACAGDEKSQSSEPVAPAQGEAASEEAAPPPAPAAEEKKDEKKKGAKKHDKKAGKGAASKKKKTK